VVAAELAEDFHPADRLFRKGMLALRFGAPRMSTTDCPMRSTRSAVGNAQHQLPHGFPEWNRSNIAKRLFEENNRPWVVTLATKKGLAASTFCGRLREHAAAAEKRDGPARATSSSHGSPRINVKELPLDVQVSGLVRKVTWLLHPMHPNSRRFCACCARLDKESEIHA